MAPKFFGPFQFALEDSVTAVRLRLAFQFGFAANILGKTLPFGGIASCCYVTFRLYITRTMSQIASGTFAFDFAANYGPEDSTGTDKHIVGLVSSVRRHSVIPILSKAQFLMPLLLSTWTVRKRPHRKT
ncbi:unnamed protein product [Prorocentrum cordatum]|uniref:Uncharacterized protein n=1 Tax=Prorocentrum cordatum TaxID=2364126 RepID=A0ABN9RV16_9DINO|nr:unnamed protein product [Polarella glacialis]